MVHLVGYLHNCITMHGFMNNAGHGANHYTAPLDPHLSLVSAVRDERRITSELRNGF